MVSFIVVGRSVAVLFIYAMDHRDIDTNSMVLGYEAAADWSVRVIAACRCALVVLMFRCSRTRIRLEVDLEILEIISRALLKDSEVISFLRSNRG